MLFLRENVTFYDAVNMLHDVITIASPFPQTAKFIFVCFRINKIQQIRIRTYSVVVYQNILLDWEK